MRLKAIVDADALTVEEKGHEFLGGQLEGDPREEVAIEKHGDPLATARALVVKGIEAGVGSNHTHALEAGTGDDRRLHEGCMDMHEV